MPKLFDISKISSSEVSRVEREMDLTIAQAGEKYMNSIRYDIHNPDKLLLEELVVYKQVFHRWNQSTTGSTANSNNGITDEEFANVLHRVDNLVYDIITQ